MSEPLTYRRWLPAVYAGAGIMIGVVVTAMTLSGRADPPERLALNHVTRPAPKPIAPATKEAIPTKSEIKPVADIKNPGAMPMDPFSGSKLVLPKLPPMSGELKGPMAFPPPPEVGPRAAIIAAEASPRPASVGAASKQPGTRYLNDIIAKGLPKAPPALQPVDAPATSSEIKSPTANACTLVTIREFAGNRQAQADEIADFAKQAGGTSDVFTQQGKGRQPLISGMLVSLPSDAVTGFVDKLSKGVSFVDQANWSGSADARRGRLAQDAKARMASLQSLREALLATYLEDAPAVKDVDEDIAKAKAELDRLSANGSATDTLAMVRIVFILK